jgi:hypothetical protein
MHTAGRTLSGSRDGHGWRAFAHAAILLCTIDGCDPVVREGLDVMTRPTADAQCLAALGHVRECDARFPDRAVLCSYSAAGDCAPYINPAQAQCLHEATCEAVRSALDRGDWLCGVPLPSRDAGTTAGGR